MARSQYIEALAAGHYAFIDLGCGTGGSIEHCVRRFGRGPGLGFEHDPRRAAEALQAGHDVVEADLLTLRVPARSVAFVSAMDVLEHLPDATAARSLLERVAGAAREFLFIRHPSFEQRDYLAGLGLKLCWADWNEHPNMMRLEEFVRLFEHFGWTEYAIFPRMLIADSMEEHVVPLSAPTDTLIYDPSVLEPKPRVRFDRPVFGQYDIFVRLTEGPDDATWERFLATDIAASAPPWPASIISPRSKESRVRAEFAFYDSTTSRWTWRRMDGSETQLSYGAPGRGLVPLVGNFSGRGRGLGLFDPTTGFFFLRHTLEEGEADVTVGFGGAAGARPVSGDWTGSGSDTVGIYVPATGQWFLRYANSSGPADESFSFGPPNAAWVPVVGDWDGDGRDSVGLYDPATGAWHLRGGSADGRSDQSFTFGPAGGIPVAGDWDADGRDSIGLYMPDWGLWLLRNTNTDGPAEATIDYRGEGAPVALTNE